MPFSVDIIYPGSLTGSENYASEPPLGPLALYSAVPADWRASMRFLDSTLLTDDQIEREMQSKRAAIVALSCTTYNYGNVIRLARVAKQYGAAVVVGGIHITHLRDQVIARMASGERPFDYLIYGAGEPGFSRLLCALEGYGEFAEIPGLVYVRNGSPIANPPARERWRSDPLEAPLDFGQIDFQSYFARFQRFGNLSDITLAAPMFTQRGCVYGGNRKCVFCSIEHANPKVPAKLIEENIVNLVANHGVDHIRISDGDFTVSPSHMSMVANAVERAVARIGKRPTFYCFARADEIDETRIRLLRRINVVAVFIGYESGSDEMLRTMHKFTTVDQNLRATGLLHDAGIDVTCGGLVLGGPGESHHSLRETLSFAKVLSRHENVRSFVATPLIPLPGSPSFEHLLFRLQAVNKSKWRLWRHADDFDIQELVMQWNRYMCRISLDDLLSAAEEIAEFFPIGIKLMRFKDNEHTNSESTSEATASGLNQETFTK